MEVRYFADIRELTGKNEQKWTGSLSTLRSLLEDLARQYGSPFRNRLFEGNQLSGTIIIFVNGRGIEFLNGLDTPLCPDDVVAIFPMVAGG